MAEVVIDSGIEVAQPVEHASQPLPGSVEAKEAVGITDDVVDDQTGEANEIPAEEKEKPVDDRPFDIDNMDFDDMDDDKEAGPIYDLSDYNFDDKTMEAINPTLQKFKAVGITDEQIKVIMDEIKPEPEEKINYRKLLNEELNSDEKKNFKTIAKFATESLEGIEGIDINDLMTDPMAIKVLNNIMKKVDNRTTINIPSNNSSNASNEDIDAEVKGFFSNNANLSKEKQKQFYNEILKKGDSEYVKSRYKFLNR